MAHGHDIDSMLGAVNAASTKALHTWLALITFGTYLAISVGSITHRDLFFENSVELPLLNVPLPLVAFFVVAPFLFIVMHLYLLMSLYILGCRIQLFEQRLPRDVPVTADQNRLRAQLDPFLIVQKLAGPVHGAVPRFLLSLTVWITVIAGPVILILAFQIQFLPYHKEWVTWWHRILIFADALMLLLLWPAAIHKSSRIWPAVVSPIVAVRKFLSHKADLSPLRAAAPWTVVSLVVVMLFILPFSMLLATFPEERVERWITARLASVDAGDEADGGHWWLSSDCWSGLTVRDGRSIWCPTAKLFEGRLNQDTGKLDSWFTRSLVLPDARLVTLGGNASAVAEPLTLRSRDFRYAILTDADLRRTQFIAANLRGANLAGAQLQGASLGVSRGTSPGPPSPGAQLQGAILDYAKLQGAGLEQAMLQGASLVGAELQDASLQSAQLQAADLRWAQLQGARLTTAHLQGASLRDAGLQGASLKRANMHAASLTDAELHGADLHGAQLQGASLENAKLKGASMDKASLWGTSPDGIDADLLSCQEATFEPPDADQISEILGTIPDQETGKRARRRLQNEVSNEVSQELWAETGCLDYDPSRSDGKLAEFLIDEVACSTGMIIGRSAPAAVGLLRRMHPREQMVLQEQKESRPYRQAVAIAILEEDRCQAVRDTLAAGDLAKLRVLADAAPPGAVASQPANSLRPAGAGVKDGTSTQ